MSINVISGKHSYTTIYCSMILPTFTYCGILQMKFTLTQIKKLLSFHARSLKIVFTNRIVALGSGQELPSAINANKIKAYKLVCKCLNNDCLNIKDYFTLQHHEKQTRKNKYILRLPARKSCSVMEAKIYTELP